MKGKQLDISDNADGILTKIWHVVHKRASCGVLYIYRDYIVTQ